MRLRLDPRLRAVLNEIRCHTLADIGCDHGRIAVGALLEGRAEKVLAIDKSAASLHKCKLLGEEAGVQDRLDCRTGDGFEPVKEGEADFAVIAGIGGREIVHILEKANYRGKLLLLPHQDSHELRRFLSGRYHIMKDFVISCGGKYYCLIVASQGGYNYSEAEIYFGRNLPQSDDYLNMLAAERVKLSKIVCGNHLTEGEIVQKWKEAEKLCQKYGISSNG